MLIAGLACAFVGCARPAPPLPIGEPQLGQVDAIAAFAAREAAIRTLRAQFSALATPADGPPRRVSGVLLVDRPQRRVRFRLMLPFGITVLDYVDDGTNDWLTLPLANFAASPRLAAQDKSGCLPVPVPGPFPSAELVMSFAESFLPTTVSRDRCQMSAVDDGRFVALCEGRYLVIRTNGTLAEDAGSDVVLRYSNERAVGGVLLPFAIDIQYRDGPSVAVAVEHYDVNPTLDPHLFELPAEAERIEIRIKR